MTSTSTFAALVEKGLLAIGDGYRAKNDELGFGGPVFLRSAYLQESGWNLDAPECFAPRRVEEFGPKVAQVGDTVITTKGNSLGRLGFVNDAVAGAVYSPHLSYWRSLDRKKIEPRWLYYWALSDLCMPQVRSMSHSTDMAPYLSLRDQLRIEIELPPLAEQRAIAGVLGALDDKIEANRRMNATLEALARALFKSWFVDFDPVRAKIEGRTPALAPDLAALFPDRLTDSPLGPIPEGWEVSRFDGVAVNVSDIAKAEELGGDEHYIGLEHMPRKSISLADWGDASGLESHKARFRVGDTLFGKLRPYFHKVGRALVDGVCSTDIVVLRAKHPVHAAYTLMHASSVEFVAFNDQSSIGTKMPRTSWSRMAEYPLVAPSGPVSQAFDEVVSPMLNRVGANVFQSRTLAQLRDLLLPKLLSSALRVRDAERMIGDAA